MTKTFVATEESQPYKKSPKISCARKMSKEREIIAQKQRKKPEKKFEKLSENP